MANNISSSYDNAIKVYSDYLPQLQAKYSNLLTQLSNEQTTAQGQQQQLFGTQKTQLTNDIAKRGLTASAGDQFFDTQQGALSSNQNVMSSDLLNKYAASRNEVVANQNEATMGISSAIAGLNTNKVSAVQAQQNWEKEQDAQKKAAKQAQKNWEKQYKAAKTKDERDYLLEIKKMNETSSKGNSTKDIMNSYLNNLSSAKANQNGVSSNGLRELIRDQAVNAGLDYNTANNLMMKYLPNGWEWGNGYTGK